MRDKRKAGVNQSEKSTDFYQTIDFAQADMKKTVTGTDPGRIAVPDSKQKLNDRADAVLITGASL